MQLVMSYYNNPGMLDVHKAEWSRYGDGCEVVLVDDGSAVTPNMSDCPIPYRLYRVLEDRPWNQDGARNLGMWNAEGWCLLTDMDHLLRAESLDAIRAMRVSKGTAWRPRRVWPDGSDRGKRHPNSYLLHASDFWRAGGYDERWCGYYSTDATFRRQLAAARIDVRDSAAFDLTLYEGIVDDAITHNLGRKGSCFDPAEYPHVRRAMKKSSRPARWLQFPWERLA